MPIPVYNSPQVPEAPLDAARVNPNQAESGLSSIGQGMQGAVSGFQQIQHEAMKAKLEDTWNKTLPETSQILTNAGQVKGGDVLTRDEEGRDFQESHLAQFDSVVESAANSLPGLAEQTAFKRQAADMRVKFQHSLAEHETKQIGVHEVGILSNTQQSSLQSIQNAVKAGMLTKDLFTTLTGRAIQAAEGLARKTYGNDPEILKSAAENTLNDAHGVILSQLIKDNKFAAANDWLKTHKDEIHGKVWDQFSSIISNENQNIEVQADAQRIAASGKDLKDQLAEVDTIGNQKGPAYLTALRSEVLQRDNQNKTFQAEAIKSHTEAVAKNLGPKSNNFAAAMNSPEMALFRAKFPNEAGNLTEKYRNSLHALIAENESNPAVRNAQQTAYYAALRNPDEFIGKTPADIGALYYKYGPYTGQLQEHALRWATPQKAAEARADAQDINTALYDLKIDPHKDKEKATRFQQYIETAIDAAQHIKAQKTHSDGTLDRAEKQAIINEAKKKITYFSPGITRFTNSNNEDFAWNLTPEMMTIPPSDLPEVQSVLKESGIKNPSKLDSWQAWQAVLAFRKVAGPQARTNPTGSPTGQEARTYGADVPSWTYQQPSPFSGRTR